MFYFSCKKEISPTAAIVGVRRRVQRRQEPTAAVCRLFDTMIGRNATVGSIEAVLVCV